MQPVASSPLCLPVPIAELVPGIPSCSRQNPLSHPSLLAGPAGMWDAESWPEPAAPLQNGNHSISFSPGSLFSCVVLDHRRGRTLLRDVLHARSPGWLQHRRDLTWVHQRGQDAACRARSRAGGRQGHGRARMAAEVCLGFSRRYYKCLAAIPKRCFQAQLDMLSGWEANM